MGKSKIFDSRGIREFYSTKGCHSCIDCKHCIDERREMGHYYECAMDSRKNSMDKRMFPYDNTKCTMFEENV